MEIRLLGEVEVHLDGQLLVFPTRKVKELFVYLVTYHQHAHSRATLAGLLWGESEEARAHASLRKALSFLRKVLGDGDWVESSSGAVRFQFIPSNCWLDVLEFERLVTGEKSIESLERAVSLYRGPFLKGVYEDWVLTEVERLQALYLETLEQLAHLYQTSREYEKAIAIWKQALQVVPWHERAHHELMVLHALRGNRAQALQQYDEYVSVLGKELQAVPLPEMRALYEKLLNGAPVKLVLQPVTDLLKEMPFVGRKRELELLNNLWQDVLQRRGQLVLIEGEIGVGKTSFVQHFISSLKESLVIQGIAYALGSELPYQPLLQAVRVGLRSLSMKILAQLPTPWQSELAQFVPDVQEKLIRIQPNPALSPDQDKVRWFAALTGFFELLARERMLVLFLDDLHWADDATLEYLSYLSAQIKNLPILLIGAYRAEETLVGSRLRVWLDKLGPGRSYQPILLSRLTREETDLLLERFLGARVEQVVPLLYQKTEGNPLFLRELVRSLIRSEMLYQDEAKRWKLLTSEIDIEQLPWSLRELLHASLRRAPKQAQSLLAPAAVIGRAFDLSVLCATLRQPEAELLDWLDELRRAGLIIEHAGCYQFYHELLRQIVYEELTRDRQRLWHHRIGQVLEALYQDRLDELAGELAGHFERAQILKKAVQYTEQAGLRAYRAYALSEALNFFTKALKLSQKISDQKSQERNLNNIGKVCFDQAQYEKALQYFYEALEISDRQSQGPSLNNIGLVYMHLGKYEQMLPYYYQALEIARETNNRRGEGICLNNIGDAHVVLGRYEEALSYYQQTLKARRDIADRWGEGIVLNNIGVVHRELGRYVEALHHHRQALEIASQVGNCQGEGYSLHDIGSVYCLQSQYDEALALYQRAFKIREEISDRRGQAHMFTAMGHVYRKRGEYAEALKYYKQAGAIFEELGTKPERLMCLSSEGTTRLGLDEQDKALACSSQAVQLLESGQTCETPHEVYFNHFSILSACNRHSEAGIYLQRAYDEVTKRVKNIKEARTRMSFLESVPVNRQILEAWETAQREQEST